MNVLMMRPQLELGGASTHIKLLASGLIQRGVRVHVASAGGAAAPMLGNAQIPLLDLPLYPSTPRNLARAVVLLRRYVLRQRVDILHSHHRFSTIVARLVGGLTRTPLVATVHEFKTDGRATAWLWAHNTTIVPSQALKTHLVSLYGARGNDIAVIPHALAPRAGAAGEPGSTRAFRNGASSIAIGYIGRLSPEKGARFFLASIPLIQRTLPSARFVVAGSGPEERELRAQAAALGLDAEALFLGNRDDVEALLDQLDVVVMPSISDNLPLLALEAMRAGCPVVASSVGGLPEAVRDGATGVLVPPADAPALATAVGALARDPDRRRAMSTRARALFAAEYDPAVVIGRTLDVYDTARQSLSKG